MNPWGAQTFADKTAQWIWNIPTAASNAPTNTTPIRFQTIINITGSANVPATVHVLSDNAPSGGNMVYLNTVQVGTIMDGGWVNANYTKIPVTLAPGYNLLEFDVENLGGPAGLLVSVLGANGNVIANTGSGTWGWVNKLPGTSMQPPITTNDYMIIGVGTDNTMYVREVINNVWGNPVQIASSGNIIDITRMVGGGYVGIATNNNLFTKAAIGASWVSIGGGTVKNISQINNGQYIGTDLDGYLYKIPGLQLNASGQQTLKWSDGFIGKSSCCVTKVIQAINGVFVAVGTDNNIYSNQSQPSNWVQVQNSGPNVPMKAIDQAPNGTFIGVGTDGNLYQQQALGAPWVYKAAGPLISLCIAALPSQIISGYERCGAFIDGPQRAITNVLGNFPTIHQCISAAKTKGYNTIGYQYFGQCFADNNPAYDQFGAQTNTSAAVTVYPGSWTNIVYKTDSTLVQSNTDPTQGQAFLFQSCQFGGYSKQLATGQYPNITDFTETKSIKVGPNTQVVLYTKPNYLGGSMTITGYSDSVNNIFACGQFIFASAQVTILTNAMPSKPSDLTETQLQTLWQQAGCVPNGTGFNQTNISLWRQKNKVPDVITDMQLIASSTNPSIKSECTQSAPKPDMPQETEVVLFEDCDFKGRFKKIKMGNHKYVGNDFNDVTSSIRIGPYTTVTIYSEPNYGGQTATWKNDSNAVSLVSCLTSNNFNDMLSSLKVLPSSAKVNYNIAPNTKDVNILGPYGMNPWGSASNFADKNAKWIWNLSTAAVLAPTNKTPIRFQTIVVATGHQDVPAVVHVMSDNAPQGGNMVKLNGQVVGQILDGGWVTTSYTQINITLAPGNNLLEFDVSNLGGPAGLIVSVIATDTNQVLADSGSGVWGWVDPALLTALEEQEMDPSIAIHDEAAPGRAITWKDTNQITKVLTGGVFKLRVSLPDVPPYIKGQQFKEGDTQNTFYLSIEKLDPNCQINDNNKCMGIYVDNKKCSNMALSNVSRVNAYRMVLVSTKYALDPSIPFGKNTDFTLIKAGDKFYLKNIQTGYMPKLFSNDYKQHVYGYMDTSYLSNINSLKNTENKLCGSETKPETPPEQEGIISKLFGTGNPRQDQKFVNCFSNSDGSMYLMTTTSLAETNPIKFVLNKDNTINLKLQQYNPYGVVDKTFTLIYCNFNVNTYAFIEQTTNPLGVFLLNMVCFDADDKRQLPKNNLNFVAQISKYPEAYLKDTNIYDLDK
ncbi:MAG: hypothetical protein Gaeavirus5_16 [Gaeavirus sp.]|uniref:Uncharacterized protein n=1 Tax=Gaeavirus sp. TaxID=2487767 RepID=A0A3G5A3I2_9VIRU|nr:MAG: hypothetical protein Gaeavirus5_16 [Gaeavirus sp.]